MEKSKAKIQGEILRLRLRMTHPWRLLSNRDSAEKLVEEIYGAKNPPPGASRVPPDRETSNQILDVLAEWNTYLEAHVPYYQEPGL